VPRSESFAFGRKATAEEWSAVNSNFQYGGRNGVLSEIEIGKYRAWKEKKAVEIEFTNLGKFIDQMTRLCIL